MAVLFFYVIVQISLPRLRARILFNLAHDNEAWLANLHEDKRIMNWQPFTHNVYCAKKKIEIPLLTRLCVLRIRNEQN